MTRTDSQEEQRFEAEESQRSPESFPRTARIENAPDSLRLRLEARRARSQAELADEETRNRTWRLLPSTRGGPAGKTTVRIRPGRKAGEAAGVGGRTNRKGATAPKGVRLLGRGNLCRANPMSVSGTKQGREASGSAQTVKRSRKPEDGSGGGGNPAIRGARGE